MGWPSPLETFVAHTGATRAAPRPRHVTDAFERYLSCGDFSQGFVRCHCDTCRHDILVAFRCPTSALPRTAAKSPRPTRPIG